MCLSIHIYMYISTLICHERAKGGGSMRMHIDICIYICIICTMLYMYNMHYVCTYIYISICVYMNISLYVYVFRCIYIYIYIYLHSYVTNTQREMMVTIWKCMYIYVLMYVVVRTPYTGVGWSACVSWLKRLSACDLQEVAGTQALRPAHGNVVYSVRVYLECIYSDILHFWYLHSDTLYTSQALKRFDQLAAM